MQLFDIPLNLKKIKDTNSGFDFHLNNPAKESDFSLIEELHQLSIPEKTKEFYRSFDGLITQSPDLEMKKLSDWEMTNGGLLVFAVFDNEYNIGFDTNTLNSANQWTIKNIENNYELTLTMRSFWSNKIWHWLRNEKEIWDDKYWE